MTFNFKRFGALTFFLCGIGATLLQLLPFAPDADVWVKAQFGWLIIPMGVLAIACCVAVFELSLFPLISRVLEVKTIKAELISLNIEKYKIVAELEKNAVNLSLLSETLETAKSENTKLASLPTFTSGHDALVTEMKKITREAQQYLYITGARTSNRSYMQEIEDRVSSCQNLIHYRVLHGYPWREELKEHLQRLRKLRPATSRIRGQTSLFIGSYIPFSRKTNKTNPLKKKGGSRNRETEFFLIISEMAALLVVPSLTNPGAFDTGLKITNSDQILAWKNYVEWLAGQSTELNDAEDIAKLPVMNEMP